MTKPELEFKLIEITQYYKRFYDTLDQADYMLKKGNLALAHDFLNIAMYRVEQIQISLETTLNELELQRNIYNKRSKYDSRYTEE